MLAVVGPLNFSGRYIHIEHDPSDPESWLIPVDGKPGHFMIDGMPQYRVMPYHEVELQIFSCFPVFLINE